MADIEDEFGEELGGDPVGDTESSEDGSDGGGGGGGGSFAWGTIAPDFITNNTSVLRALLNNPRGFVLGAVLTTILEAVTGVVTTAIGQLVLIVGGSEPTRFNAPGETLGLADVPVAIVDAAAAATGGGGEALLTGIESFNETLFAAAATAGPLAPLVVITIASIEALVVVLALRRLVYVLADLLQLGGLTE